MTNNAELKPCPWCGDKGHLIVDAENNQAVRCGHCFHAASVPEWNFAYCWKRESELLRALDVAEKALESSRDGLNAAMEIMAMNNVGKLIYKSVEKSFETVEAARSLAREVKG